MQNCQYEHNYSLPIYFAFTYFWCTVTSVCVYAWMRLVWIRGTEIMCLWARRSRQQTPTDPEGVVDRVVIHRWRIECLFGRHDN